MALLPEAEEQLVQMLPYDPSLTFLLDRMRAARQDRTVG